MDLTSRQRSILEILLDEWEQLAVSGSHYGSDAELCGREATLGQIARRLGVSTRTVHRDIARLALPLKRDFSIVLSGRPGSGIALVGTAPAIADCRQALVQSVASELDAEDRRRMVALMLLGSDDVVKIMALTWELGVSTSLIRRDLEHLGSWFSFYGLSLVLRKGLGVRLEGSEDSRRRAIASIIAEQLGDSGLLAVLHDDSYCDGCLEEPLGLLFGYFPAGRFRLAEAVLAGLAKGSLPALAPRDYLDLVIHLAVALARNQAGSHLGPSAVDLTAPETPAVFDSAAGAAAIVAAFNGALQPADAETAALERFLRGAKLESTGIDQSGRSVDVMNDVCLFVDECASLLDRPLAEDRMLRNGLAAHWGPACYRLRNGLPIRNPLLDRIRSEYNELFAVVRKACDTVFSAVAVNDDEVAYLVMHVGSALSRAETASEHFRALVVCSAGIGSAYMLASRIRAELPEIEIVANLSWFDVQSKPRESWDILISTIALPVPDTDYVLVDPLLSAEGIALIRRAMTARKGWRKGEGSLPAARPVASDLKQLRSHLATVIEILDNLRVYTEQEVAADWERFQLQAIERCTASGLIGSGPAALRDLKERSRDYGILLPNSRVLFLHARGDGVTKSSLTVHAFRTALPRWHDLWTDQPYVLVLLLAPRAIDRETQDILNEISVSLLDEQTIGVLHSAVEADIRTHYVRYLERYFRSISLEGVDLT